MVLKEKLCDSSISIVTKNINLHGSQLLAEAFCKLSGQQLEASQSQSGAEIIQLQVPGETLFSFFICFRHENAYCLINGGAWNSLGTFSVYFCGISRINTTYF